MTQHLIQLIQSQQSNSTNKHQISIEELYLLCKDFEKSNDINLKSMNERKNILDMGKYFYFSAEDSINAFISLFDFIKNQYGSSTTIDTSIDYFNEVDCAKLYLNIPMNYFITWILDENMDINNKQCFLMTLGNNHFIYFLKQLCSFSLKTNFNDFVKMELIIDCHSKSITTKLGTYDFTFQFITQLYQLNYFQDVFYLCYENKYHNLPTHIKPLFHDLLEHIEIDKFVTGENELFIIDFNQFPINVKNLIKLLNQYSDNHNLQSLYFLSEAEMVIKSEAESEAESEAIAIASLSLSDTTTASLLRLQIANDVLLSTSIKSKPENNTWLLEHLTSSSLQGKTFKHFEFLINENGKLALSQDNEPCDVIKTEDVLRVDTDKQKVLLYDIVNAIYYEYTDVYSKNNSTFNGFINDFLPKLGFSNSDERAWLDIWVQDENAKNNGFYPLTDKKINTILEKSIVKLELDWDFSYEYPDIKSYSIYITIV